MDQSEFEGKVYAMRKRCGENGIRRECWNKEDNEKLREMFDQCFGLTEIAVLLDRTERAVSQQVQALGLYERVYPPRERPVQYKCQCQNCRLSSQCSNPGFCPLNRTTHDSEVESDV